MGPQYASEAVPFGRILKTQGPLRPLPNFVPENPGPLDKVFTWGASDLGVLFGVGVFLLPTVAPNLPGASGGPRAGKGPRPHTPSYALHLELVFTLSFAKVERFRERRMPGVRGP